MKFGQLIQLKEYNMRWEIFFLENHTRNVVEKLVPDRFIKKIKTELISE